MIERQRGCDVSLCRENDQSDAIVGTLINKAFQNVSCHVETIDGLAVDLEILGDHAAGHIQRHDDIDAAGVDFSLAASKSWLRQSDDENGQCQPAERREKAAGTRLSDIQDPPHQLHRGIDEGWWFAALAFEPGHDWQQEKQEEKVWVAESHLSAGCGVPLVEPALADG